MKSAQSRPLFPASMTIRAGGPVIDAQLEWLLARDPAVSGTLGSIHLDHRLVRLGEGIPNMLATGSEQIHAIDAGCCVHLMNGAIAKAWRLTASAANDCLRLRLTFLSGAEYRSSDAMVHEQPSTCTFIVQPRGTSLTGAFHRNAEYRYCSINMTRSFLIDALGLEAADLPPPLLSHWQRDQTAIGQFPLDRALLAIVDRMFTVEGSENWRRIQIKAMTLEAIRRTFVSWDRAPAGDRQVIRLDAGDREALTRLRNHADAIAPAGIPLQTATRLTGINRNKIQLGFRQMFGMSLQQYCLDLRMQQACALLRDGSKTIAAIGAMVGFSEPTNFTAAFRKHFGLPPSRYADRHRSRVTQRSHLSKQ